MIGLACQCMLMAAVAAAPQAKAQRAWPFVRDTNYVALLPKPGQRLAVEITSRQAAKIYADELQYALLAAGGRVRASGRLALGERVSVSADVQAAELLALELVAGWNGCLVDAGPTPAAYIASELHPLHVVGVNGPFYFYVPNGCRRFAVCLTAGAPREAAHLVVRTPDGQTAKDEEGDYDEMARIRIDVPRDAAGKVWTLDLEKPKTAGFYADDVTIGLDSSVAPYLAKRADWALEFGRRRHK